ncbi:MAG: hypothetical protein ACHQU0_03460 [Candidatus Paceibacteria bacterium]
MLYVVVLNLKVEQCGYVSRKRPTQLIFSRKVAFATALLFLASYSSENASSPALGG